MAPPWSSSALSFTSCAMWQTSAGRNSKAMRTRRRESSLLSQASVIYQAGSAADARTLLSVFAQAWQARAPKTVATFTRDFEQTIAYYTLEGVARELIRTTSLLERTNRELRRKCASSLQ